MAVLMGAVFLGPGLALDSHDFEEEGLEVEEGVPSQDVVIGGDEVMVPGVASQNVSTPEVHVEETCLPMDLICVGPATLLDEQNLLTTPGTQNETHPVPELLNETTSAVKVRVVLDNITGSVEPLGPPTEVGPLTIMVPNPFGEDLPVTVCASGCPLPVSVGSNLVESGLTVAVLIEDEEFHSMHLPIRLATGPGEGNHVIHGTVTDADARVDLRVAGALVSATPVDSCMAAPEALHTVTDPTGRYILFLPCEGEYMMKVDHPLYIASDSALVTASDGDSVTLATEFVEGTGQDFGLKRETNDAEVYVRQGIQRLVDVEVEIDGIDTSYGDSAETWRDAAIPQPAPFFEVPWGVYHVDLINRDAMADSILVVYPRLGDDDTDQPRPQTSIFVDQE